MSPFPDLSASTWALLAAWGALLLLYGIWPYSVFTTLGIPGPRPLPFFGTFLEYRKGFLQFDLECFKKYGKTWGIYDGRQPALAVLDPELIKVILVKEFHNLFTNRRNFGLNGGLESSLTTAEDGKWKYIRAVTSPAFTSGKLREMFPLIRHHCTVLMDNVRRTAARGEPVDMKTIFGAYSLDVITSTSFGVDTDSINNPNDALLCHIKKLVSFSFLNPLLVLIVLFPFLVPLLERMKVTAMPREELDFFVNITQRLKKERQASGRRDRVDFLQLMIDSQASANLESSRANQSPQALTDMEISAQAITFIFAGYETTSSTLSFIAYHLATHPEVQERLQGEIDRAFPNKADPTYDILFQMEYLDMVVSETLRLFPPGPRLERVCKKSTEIRGQVIPKGMVVMIPTYALHRDPEHWPEPEEFRPERFSKAAKTTLDPYVFLPFGAGPRNCVGMRFALLSLKAALVVLLQNFSLETCKETPIPLELGTKGFMQPKKPIVLKLRARADTESRA
ncbi:cytochrome P450 3A4-like [Tamandua tetradactyla]|uniref:cytochrome P450 3A4-like n=1 Tax=Tamandua tetradactyla TaxID=48850 RepID=UPI0040541BEA